MSAATPLLDALHNGQQLVSSIGVKSLVFYFNLVFGAKGMDEVGLFSWIITKSCSTFIK